LPEAEALPDAVVDGCGAQPTAVASRATVAAETARRRALLAMCMAGEWQCTLLFVEVTGATVRIVGTGVAFL
jgi:hypothetical protein